MENVLSETGLEILVDFLTMVRVAQWYLLAVAVAGVAVCAVMITVLWRRVEIGRRRRATWVASVAAGLFVLLGGLPWWGPAVAVNFLPPSGSSGIGPRLPVNCDDILRRSLLNYSGYGELFNAANVNVLIARINRGARGCEGELWSPRAYDVVPGTYLCEAVHEIGMKTPPLDQPVRPRPTVLPLELAWEERWPAHRTVSYRGTSVLVYFTSGLVGRENWSPPDDGAKCWVGTHSLDGGSWWAGY